jgi:hypothetical protein
MSIGHIGSEALLNSKITRQIRNRWERMEKAFHGGEEFKHQFLWRYEREDEEDWLHRLQRAVYENHLRDLIARREAILFGRTISRSIHSSTLPWSEVSGNVDGCNNNWTDFIRKCFIHSQLFGFAAVLVDRPSNSAISAQDENLRRVRPVLRLLHPQRLINWQWDDSGVLEWVVIQTADSPCLRRLLTRNGSRLFDCSNTEIKEIHLPERAATNSAAGTIPVALLTDQQDGEKTPGLSSLQSACELSVLYFNQSNWYDQLLYKTNYSTLAATPFAGSHEEEEMIVGSGDVFWVPEGGMVPAWISPETAPADVFERRLAYMRRRIYELAVLDVGHVEDKTRDLSGMAYAVRRLPTEEMAMRLARNLKNFEEKLIHLIYETAGHEATIEINYPQRYGVRPLRDAMKDIETIEKSSLLPDEVKAYIASQIVFTEGFADLSDEKQRQFEQMVMSHRRAVVE